MSEAYQYYPEKVDTPKKPAKPRGRGKQTDVAGRPLTFQELKGVMKDLREGFDIHERAGLSAAMAEAEEAEGRRAAVREASRLAVRQAAEHRLALAKTAEEIASEQSELAEVPERSVKDLTRRLENLRANRRELSFFDFAGKRAVDEQIKRAENQLIQAKENRRHRAQAIVAEKLSELSPITELPDSAVKTLSLLEAELEAKQLELGTASAINPFNWPRRSRLQEEISVLKKKIAGQRIAKAMKGRD